jgi:hypothetical protein
MAFRVTMLEVVFHIEACYSLKEKRSRLSGLRERFGKHVNLAVCEADFQDEHGRSLWAFVAVGQDKIVDKTLSYVEEHIEEYVDAVVVDIRRQEL